MPISKCCGSFNSMKSPKFSDIIVQAIVACYIFLFLTTAIDKLRHSSIFIYSVSQVPFLKSYAHFLSGFLPGIEIGIVILLIIPLTRKFGLILSTGLMAVFSVYLIVMLLTMENLPCSCGGIIQFLSWPLHLLVNGTLMLAGIYSLHLSKKIIAINRDSRIPV